jgi:glycerol-3-phosphate O-acyltransferase
LKPREEIIKAVLEVPDVIRTIERLAQAGAEDEQTLRERARRCLQEIAADYNERWLRIWEKVLSRLWRAIYDDFVVDTEGMALIRDLSQKMPFVIIPCHRSHIDYLIIGYILYMHGIPLPCVAAGDNMNFWPLGYIFRQSGAFFLRRSFQGDDLYADVFAAYVGELLREGVPIEFFVEGGRSRTGKMLLPRYGMISMIIRAYKDKIDGDLALIPVSVGYDRIVEENSYLKELSGVPKRRESMLDVIKHTKIMMHRYGRAYINVGAPIFLKSYFDARPRPFAEMSSDNKEALYREIGSRVVSEINRVSVVTPVALVAAALLCHTEKEISGKLLTSTFAALYDYLSRRKVNFAPALAMGEKAVPSVLELFITWGYLSSKGDGNGTHVHAVSYLILHGKRLNLEYYKNNIMHHFLSVSLAALSILSCREEETFLNRIREDCLFLKSLFRQEFIFEGDGDRESEDALSYLEQSGIINRAEGKIVWKAEEAKDKLMPYAGLFRSYLESYWVVLNAFSPDENEFPGGEDMLNYLRRLAEEMYEKGDIRRTESLSQENYKNALKFLQEDKILNVKTSQGSEKGEGEIFVADKNRMEILRVRLSSFI